MAFIRRSYWGDIPPILRMLSDPKREIIERYIMESIRTAHPRVGQAILATLDDGIEFDDFAQKFLKKKIEVSQVRNIGPKYTADLQTFVQKIEQFALQHAELPEEDPVFNPLRKDLLETVSLEAVSEKHHLLIRTRNICEINNLHNLKEIICYFLKHSSFAKLRNVGTKTEAELEPLCMEYLSNPIYYEKS
ncbi:MAG: hypothetical protein RL329_14 [Bacteroidota bacterium]|jgi:hypothetical protein